MAVIGLIMAVMSFLVVLVCITLGIRAIVSYVYDKCVSCNGHEDSK